MILHIFEEYVDRTASKWRGKEPWFDVMRSYDEEKAGI